METFKEYIEDGKDELLYKLAELEYDNNSDVWRDQMSEEQDEGLADPATYERDEVVEFIANKYTSLSIDELRKAIKFK